MKINPLAINFTFLVLGWLTCYVIGMFFGENGRAFLLVTGIGSLVLLVLYLTREEKK